MGLILDSSVLIAAERQGQNARQMLSPILILSTGLPDGSRATYAAFFYI
jgi:hypothetical protein